MRRGAYGAILVILFHSWNPLNGITVEDLLKEGKLTPQDFAEKFTDFKYRYRVRIQNPNVFLFTRQGDCDDFATLADQVLSHHGYETKLVTVRMPGLTHVVCYIEKDKIYLDFNNRSSRRQLTRCREGLEEIAKKVAWTFGANWTSATEFTYKKGLKHHVRTIAKTGRYR
jgi:hypothetical protein